MVQSVLEFTTLRSLTKSTEIYYDPDPLNSVVEQDREMAELHFYLDEEELKKVSPWMLRIELDSQAFTDKHEILTMRKIADAIKDDFANDLHVIWSDDTELENLALQVRLKDDDNNKVQEEFDESDDEFLLKVE